MENFYGITSVNIIVSTNSFSTLNIIVKSSRPDVFCKKGVLRNFAKCTGKHLCQSLFEYCSGILPQSNLKQETKIDGGAMNFFLEKVTGPWNL